MADLLLEAMEAKNKGEKDRARQILAQAIVQDPHNEGAWMLMAEVVDESRLKRNCFQRALMINPKNEAARLALRKLDTSPLGPIVRGDRYQPVIPDKTPPFTPPFTWTGDDQELQAMGEMTYPDLTGSHVNQPAETPPTFDWAAESSEPDKTIDQIFNRVSNPEAASTPVADTDLEKLAAQPVDENPPVSAPLQEEKEPTLDETVAESVIIATQAAPNMADNSPAVSADQPQTSLEDSEPDSLLWDNPAAKKDRLIILGVSSIIHAQPAESDIPHILGLFDEKKMMRDLLGENVGTIKLDTINRLTAIPRKADLSIRFGQNGKATEHKFVFSSSPVRNEALSALEHRLGNEFAHRLRKTSLKDKLLLPLIGIIVIAVLVWFCLSGLPMLNQLAVFQTGILHVILYNIQYYVDMVEPLVILMIGVVLVVLLLVWMVANLAKPGEVIVIEKK